MWDSCHKSFHDFSDGLFTALIPQDDGLDVFDLTLFEGLHWVEDGDTRDVGSLSHTFKTLSDVLALIRHTVPFIFHGGHVLLELSFGLIAVHDKNLELRNVRVLISFLDEISERLHEALARRAVLGGEKNCNMGDACADEGIIN